MKTCRNCAYCKVRVGFLKLADYCRLYRVQAVKACADWKERSHG